MKREIGPFNMTIDWDPEKPGSVLGFPGNSLALIYRCQGLQSEVWALNEDGDEICYEVASLHPIQGQPDFQWAVLALIGE